MSLVSKYPVKKEVEKRMFGILLDTIARLRLPSEVDEFLEDFLSPVEKIVLAKRLSIAVLLLKGYGYETIGAILKVTPPTIAKVNESLKYGKPTYKKVIEKIIKEEKMEEFWSKIDDFISDIFPPGPKGTNWSLARREREAKKRAARKAF